MNYGKSYSRTIQRNFIVLIFHNSKPFGISNLTAFTASNAVPHSLTITERHFPCTYGKLENRSTWNKKKKLSVLKLIEDHVHNSF